MISRVFSRLISGTVILTYTLAVSGVAEARPVTFSYQKRDAMRRQIVERFLRSTTSMYGLALNLSAGGVSSDDIHSILKDVKRRLDNAPFPSLELAKGELQVNDQPSGIHVRFENGGSVSYHGRTWNLDPSKSPAENYVSLTQFLTGRPSVSLIDFLLPSAQAGGGGGTFLGAFVGGVAGAILGVFFLGALPLEALVAGAIATTVGGAALLGWLGNKLDKSADHTKARAAIEALMHQSFSLACSSDGVTVVPMGENPIGSIVLNWKNAPDARLVVTTKDGDHMELPESQLGPLTMLRQCKTKDDADKLVSEWKKVIAKADTAMDAPKVQAIDVLDAEAPSEARGPEKLENTPVK